MTPQAERILREADERVKRKYTPRKQFSFKRHALKITLYSLVFSEVVGLMLYILERNAQ
jgi:hypothetical protein